MTMKFDAPVPQTDRLNVLGATGSVPEGIYNPNRDVSKIGLEWLRMAMHMVHNHEKFLSDDPYRLLLQGMTDEEKIDQLVKVQQVWATALADIRDNYRLELEQHLATAGFHTLKPETQLLAMALLGEVVFCVIIRSVHDLTPKHGLPPQVRQIDALHAEALKLADLIRKNWKTPWYRRTWRSIRSGVKAFWSRIQKGPSTTS